MAMKETFIQKLAFLTYRDIKPWEAMRRAFKIKHAQLQTFF
jgi:hypothetical protein